MAEQDTDDDDGESVLLGFENLPTGVSAGTTAEATVSITDDDDPSVSVSFGAAAYTVTEGGTVDVTVTLNADPERTVTIPLTKTDQGGASSADYSGVPANVTFVPGDTEETINFSATEDTLNDDGESVKLTLGNLPAGVSAGNTDEAVVTITDDDAPSVEVSFEQGAYTIAEGSAVPVKVILSEDPERTVTVPLTKTDQGGASSADYSGVPLTLTFNSGVTEAEITFFAASDSENDDGESVKLGFGALPTGVSAGTTNETVVSITDDDLPSVTANFEQATYTVSEGDTVDVTVTLSEDPEESVTIPLRTANQGGASDSDYTGVPASVTFNSGETEKTFIFRAVEDNLEDRGESVKLGFGNILPAGVSAGNTDEAVVTITDDDAPSVAVSFEQSSYSVDEGDTVDVTVTLSADPERTVTVPVTAEVQDGASSADYSGVPASVEFAPGETEQTFTFTASSDSDNDDGESVKLGFGNTLPADVSAGGTDETTVSITDDDAPSVAVSFEQSSYSVDEGDTVDVTVTLSEDPERTVTIPLRTANQGGTSDSDYSGVPASVTFSAGDTEKTFTFTAVEDNLEDGGESVKLSFGILPDRVTAGTTDEATVSIINKSAQNSLTVAFDFSEQELSEGGMTTVTVRLNIAPGSDVTIPLTKTEQGGASSADYSGVPDSVEFTSEETEKSFDFMATQDDDDDDGKSVKIGFGTLLGGVTVGGTDETTMFITDDDTADLVVSPSSLDIGEAGSGTFTVKLATQPSLAVTVSVTSGDTGAATVSQGSLSFSAATWNDAQTVTVSGVNDADTSDESLSVTLEAGSTDVDYSSKTASVSVTITDDDVMEVSFESSEYSVNEGAGVEVMVKLDPAPDHRMDIQLQKTNMNGASDGDYFVNPSMLTFERGETEKRFTFFAEPDNESDDGETVMMSFAALPAMVQKGDPSESIVTLRDNVSLSQDGITCIDNNRAAIVTVLSARGVISSPGEIDTWVIPEVDPYRTYLVEILGADSSVDLWGQNAGGGSLTLADPHPVSLFHEEWEGTVGTSGFNPGASDGGTGHNARFIFIFSGSGDYVLKVESGDEEGTGSYHVLVRYDNYCIVREDGSIQFPYEGGPEGYAFDVRDDTTTKRGVYDRDSGPSYYASGGHLLGDNWGSMPDEDWFRLEELEADTEYEVYLEADPDVPEKHRLTGPRIVGIYDNHGNEVHEGAAAIGTDTSLA